MKKFLVSFFVLVIAFSLCVAFRKVDDKRYFFVGYSSKNDIGGVWIITEDKRFISYGEAVSDVKKYMNIDTKISITSFYEFTNYTDYEHSLIGYEKSQREK